MFIRLSTAFVMLLGLTALVSAGTKNPVDRVSHALFRTKRLRLTMRFLQRETRIQVDRVSHVLFRTERFRLTM